MIEVWNVYQHIKTKAYFSLYNIGKIDVDMRDCLIKRIEDM